MWRPSAWPMANAASRLTASISRHCAPVACRTVWFSCRRGLALCTKIETLPSLSIASSAARCAPSSVDRSQRSSAPSRSAPSTRAPSAASASAMPRPMPRAEPVTSAVSPSRSLAGMRSAEPGLRPLGGEPFPGLRRLDDEAHVRAAPDFLNGIFHRELENHFAPVYFRHLDFNRYLQAEGRGAEVINRDMRADRILARVEMLQEEVAAGELDIVHHAGRGVHHALPAHEADAASLVDRERAVRRKILLQRRLHGALDLIVRDWARRSYTTRLALDPVFAMAAHPETRQIGPGACRRCGMALEPAAGVLSAFTGLLLNPMIAAAAMRASSVSVVMSALAFSRPLMRREPPSAGTSFDQQHRHHRKVEHLGRGRAQQRARRRHAAVADIDQVAAAILGALGNRLADRADENARGVLDAGGIA